MGDIKIERKIITRFLRVPTTRGRGNKIRKITENQMYAKSLEDFAKLLRRDIMNSAKRDDDDRVYLFIFIFWYVKDCDTFFFSTHDTMKITEENIINAYIRIIFCRPL